MIRISALFVLVSSLFWTSAASANQCFHGAFNGFYAGAAVGYARLDADHHPRGEPSLSDQDHGVIVSGIGGYNMQCERVVIGLEGDVSYLSGETLATQPDGTTFRTEYDAMVTLRGRLGYLVRPDTLIYATAGVAWAKRTHALYSPAAPGGPFSQSDDEWATGWVVGAGAEFLRRERWLIRMEVLYADLGEEDRTYVTSPTACTGICRAYSKWDDEVLTARIGISYKFGYRPRPEPYK